MRILVINIDSVKIPNLALEKLKCYYREQGADIIIDNPLMINNVDRTYISCVFTKNVEMAREYARYKNVQIGGTGWDTVKKLPYEIDSVKPKINIDFASRGCIRDCSFCIVRDKEGPVRADRDIYDIWDGISKKIILLDNNILAIPKHFELVCGQAQKENLWLDFNQGLDVRLVDDKVANILSKTKLKEIRFALDDVGMISMFGRKLKILRKHLPNKYFFVYVLSGYNSTFEEDLERLEFLKKEKCRPYLMRHEKVNGNKKYIELARWVNQPYLFAKYSFAEFKKLDGKKPDINQRILF